MSNKEEIIRTAKRGDLGVIYELIDQGADPFTKDHNGRTAISYILPNINRAQMKDLSKKIDRYLYVRNKNCLN